MKSILIVTGSLPPEVCGVGDYAQLLADELKKRITVSVFHENDWSIGQFLRYAGRIRRCGADVINIQYPTQGYGRSILPHLLSLTNRSKRTIVTLHEFSRGSMMGQLSMRFFFYSAHWLIFTTEYERNMACKTSACVGKKSSVIPIGSNIAFSSSTSRDIDVSYFGRICPLKGLEEFIAALRMVTPDKKLNIKAIGQIPTQYENYANDICAQLNALGVEVILNAPGCVVSNLLSRTRIAFLPFPDGMSLRRGSALAAMGNGALLLTTASVCDASALEGRCVMADKESELYEMLGKVLNDYSSYDGIRRSGQEFAQSRSWDKVASSYIDIIDDVLSKKSVL